MRPGGPIAFRARASPSANAFSAGQRLTYTEHRARMPPLHRSDSICLLSLAMLLWRAAGPRISVIFPPAWPQP